MAVSARFQGGLDGRLTAPGFEQLLSLADQGVIQILDMEFIAKDAEGMSKKVTSGRAQQDQTGGGGAIINIALTSCGGRRAQRSPHAAAAGTRVAAA